MEQGCVLEARGLSKGFSPKRGAPLLPALKNVSFSLARGETTALIGADGAGKTTLMRVVCGLMRPDGGDISIFGLDAVKSPQKVQEHLSYMPQRFGLYDDLTVEENLGLYAEIKGLASEERGERFGMLLEMTGLADFTDRLAGKLSGGMKQKLGLACTLVRSPGLLVLDEPTVGVDPLSRRELWQILRRLAETEELTVFFSTAYMDEAERCGRVLMLHKGELIANGTPGDISALARGRSFAASAPQGVPSRTLQARLLDDRDAVTDAVPDRGAVRFIKEPGGRQPAAIEALGLTAEAVPARLEDSFMITLRRLEAGSTDTDTGTLGEAGGVRHEAPGDAERVIEVKNLVKKFGSFTAVANTSFTVHRGEIFGLLGPNGAGKTTTFRMLCGLLPLTSGSLSVAGFDLRTQRTEARVNIGYVAQKFSLYTELSVLENLRFCGAAYGLRPERLRRRISESVAQFGLTGFEETEAGNIPGGCRQRLAMAAALLHEPGILFLDEPTSGIDPIARRAFWRRITALAACGTTVIITTHFMEEAEYCDRIMIQDQGHLLAIGEPAALRAEFGEPSASMDDVFAEIIRHSREEHRYGDGAQ